MEKKISDICAVCYQPLDETMVYFSPGCFQHPFHQECVLLWAQTSVTENRTPAVTCPVCRTTNEKWDAMFTGRNPNHLSEVTTHEVVSNVVGSNTEVQRRRQQPTLPETLWSNTEQEFSSPQFGVVTDPMPGGYSYVVDKNLVVYRFRDAFEGVQSNAMARTVLFQTLEEARRNLNVSGSMVWLSSVTTEESPDQKESLTDSIIRRPLHPRDGPFLMICCSDLVLLFVSTRTGRFVSLCPQFNLFQAGNLFPLSLRSARRDPQDQTLRKWFFSLRTSIVHVTFPSEQFTDEPLRTEIVGDFTLFGSVRDFVVVALPNNRNVLVVADFLFRRVTVLLQTLDGYRRVRCREICDYLLHASPRDQPQSVCLLKTCTDNQNTITKLHLAISTLHGKILFWEIQIPNATLDTSGDDIRCVPISPPPVDGIPDEMHRELVTIGPQLAFKYLTNCPNGIKIVTFASGVRQVPLDLNYLHYSREQNRLLFTDYDKGYFGQVPMLPVSV